MTGKLIILEGADCAGKTTLANRIIDFYGQDRTAYYHSTYNKDMDVFADHKRTLDLARAELENRAVVILDRHWISECIYGTVYRDGCSYSHLSAYFHNQIMQLGGEYILCIPEKQLQLQQHAELSKTRQEMFADISGVVDAYWDLWHGKPPAHGLAPEDIQHQNHVSHLTAIGGVHNLPHFHRWNWAEHDAYFAEFIQTVIQGGKNE